MKRKKRTFVVMAFKKEDDAEDFFEGIEEDGKGTEIGIFYAENKLEVEILAALIKDCPFESDL